MNTPALLPSGKEPGDSFNISQQNRGSGASSPSQLNCSWHATAVPCPGKATGKLSWWWDARTHSWPHRVQHGVLLVVSMSQKISSPSQADLPGIILNHLKNGECKNPGHKILTSTLCSREQRWLPTQWETGTNNKHLPKRWSLSK